MYLALVDRHRVKADKAGDLTGRQVRIRHADGETESRDDVSVLKKYFSRRTSPPLEGSGGTSEEVHRVEAQVAGS